MAAKKCLICSSSFSGRRDAKTCSARCRKRLQLVRFNLHAPTKRQLVSKVLTVAAFGVFGTLALLFANSSPTVQAATSTFFNFQARLLTSTGAVVADGNYNIEFKIYDDIDDGQGSLLWTETRKVDGGPDNRVRVVSGYFSVKLGEVTALPSINWNQELFLTMNIGGTTTGAPSWDGEMLNSSKRIQLTAVPYAFTAKELQMTSGSFTNTLLFATPSGSSKTITIPNETGTVCTTGSVCSGYQAAGSLTLQSAYDAGAAGDQVITLDSTQDSIVIRNPSSSGSDSTYVLTLDQLATGARGGLSIQSAGTGNLLLITDTTATAADVLTIADGGAATFKNQTNSATAFQIQNAASGSLLQVDSTTGGAITLLGNNSGELTSWTSDTDTLPAARGAVATASYNGYVYAIAGFTTGGTAQDDIYYARLNANGGVSAWTTESDLLPANRKHMAAVAANGYLYTFGGQSAGVNTATSNVYYTKLNGDGSTGAWSELTASVLPSARSEIGAFIYNNYVYIIGGSSGDSDQATATTYDTSYYAYLNADGTLGPWNTTTILPAARGMVQPVTANGYVYVIGGTDTDANTVNTSYYAKLNADGTIGAWTADPDTLPTSRGTGGVVINNGYIYYMGGWISGGSSTQSTTYYSPLSSDGSIGAWTTNTAAFAEARDALKGFTANGYLYAIGGTTSGTVKDTIYYASGSRVTIGGGLDLVGLAGENLSEGGSGGTLTAGNTKIVGSLEVQGQTSFSQNVGIGGSLSVGGTVAIQPSLDSTAGFKVADRLGKAIISVNTSTLDNLLLDGNFEGNVSTGGSGWTAVGSATLTSDATQFKIGARSLKAATSVATTPSGMSYNFPFKARTAYTLSFWARADSTLSAANEEFGFLVNGTSNNCTDSGLSTTWVYHTCTFTTGATVLITDSIYMREVDTGAAYSIYLDGVMLEEGSSASSFYVDPGFGLTNLITNPSFENGNHNGWTEKGSSINFGLSGDYVKFGVLAHVFTTTAVANDGTQYRFPFRPSTQYSLSLWMRLDTGTTSSINVGRADTAGSDSNCLTGQTVDTTWRQFACTFSTGATIGEASSLYIKQTDAASKNIKVDGVTLVQASSGLSFVADGSAVQADNLNSNLTLNGSNNGEIQAWKQSSNDLPVIKNAGTSAVANGYLYVIGGDNGTVNVDTVYYTKLKADGSISAWQSGTVLPAAIAHPTAAVANGYLYVLGGKTSSTYQNKVYYAKLNTDGSYGAWQTNSNALGTAVYRHTTVVNKGYIYVIGGQISDTPTRTANTYYAKLNADGSTGPFTSTTALPASKGFHTSFVTNGYVFVIGGDGTPDSYSAPLNANGTIGSWTNLSPSAPPTATYANGGVPVFAGGYFYLLGGRDVNNNYRANVIYNKISEDFDINQWQTSQYSLPANRAYYELAQANGYIYVVGGFDGSASHVTTYYASLPRTLLGGGLDLVGLGSQNLAEYGGGGDLTAGNTQIVGSLQVQGQTSFAQSIGVNGNGTFNGDIAVLAQTNNTPHSFGSTCDCLVNTTAGTFGAETLRDAAFSGAVYNGKLYVATKETDASAIYRYDGDKAFTKVTDAAGKIIAGDTANIDASVLTVYNGKLYAGTQTGSASGTAAVYSYDGTTWTLLLATRGTFGAETARAGVSALRVVNGRLYAYP
ncbi:carbohydrate binding domain-containing protein, partial [Candidatus Saccharibacteria bacterium]|nr:carbohydrate binding domain-containing protein [Candidatus Saccharibacteria bacterium]